MLTNIPLLTQLHRRCDERHPHRPTRGNDDVNKFGWPESAIQKVCEILDQIDEDVIVDAVADEQDMTDQKTHSNPDFDMQENERHGHVPYHSTCRTCVAAKARDSPHVRKEHPEQISAEGYPEVQADFCYLGTSDVHDELAPLFVAVVKHTGAGFSFRLKSKAVDPVAVAACVRFLYEQGLHDTVKLKTDPENSIISFARSIAKARSPASTILLTTAVGSWQSKGAVEGYIHKLGDNCRAIKHLAETRTGNKLKNENPLYTWMVMYASWIHNRFQPIGERKVTPYESVRGKPYDGHVFPFASVVMVWLPPGASVFRGAQFSLPWQPRGPQSGGRPPPHKFVLQHPLRKHR